VPIQDEPPIGEVLRQTIENLPVNPFSEAPVNLLGGNETLIYAFRLAVEAGHAFHGPLIIRIFANDYSDSRQYLWEATAHDVLGAMGFPVPRILLASAEPGLRGPWLVMEQIEGAMLGSEAFEMPGGVLRFPGLYRNLPGRLARLHLKLHALDPAPMVESLRAIAPEQHFNPAGRLQSARNLVGNRWPEARRVADRLLAMQPPVVRAVICHGDFHPLNVMVDNDRVTGVLDWGRICFADREYDLAAAWLLLQASILEMPAAIVPLVNRLKRGMADRFLRFYQRRFSIDRDKLDFYCAQRAFEELVLRGEGHTPDMGRVGGWDFGMLGAVVEQQTGLCLRGPRHRG
jgi:aminoglycoside phosphotransferase (APT) family kinase protein|tara:strand:- start:338 stop:1372 length:1035 start_codon:yes stop_codon:yes gene_type:complete